MVYSIEGFVDADGALAICKNRAKNVIVHALAIEEESNKNSPSEKPSSISVSAIAAQLVLLSHPEIKKAWENLSTDDRKLINTTSHAVVEQIKNSIGS